MEIYRVTFAGHREVNDFFSIEKRLEEVISNLINSKEFIEFYVGNDGEFDIMSTSAIRRIKNKYGSERIALTLVLPYKKANLDLLESQFDSIIIPEELNGIHPKKAITERNKYMVDNADLLVCYVNKTQGGAATAMKHAEKKRIKIINLSAI